MTQRKKRKVAVTIGREGIPIRQYLPDDLPIHHVDNMNIVHVAGVFYLSFLQIQMPLISDDSEFVKLKEIPSTCVARLVMREEVLNNVIEVLTKHLTKVRDKRKAAEDSDGDTEGETESHLLSDADTSD